jgi:hypothetical protein
MKKYQIEVTERQLQLLSYACEKADRQTDYWTAGLVLRVRLS